MSAAARTSDSPMAAARCLSVTICSLLYLFGTSQIHGAQDSIVLVGTRSACRFDRVRGHFSGGNGRNGFNDRFTGRWLRQMGNETRLVAALDVFLLSIAAQGDAGKVVPARRSSRMRS